LRCLLESLINNKRPPRFDPGGHSFVFLNVSINKKLFFFSEVVVYKNGWGRSSTFDLSTIREAYDTASPSSVSVSLLNIQSGF
jgi:hypothetical protein